MKKILGLLLVTTGLLAGCATDPLQDARINTCSREANAYSVSTRIGNSAYWGCLDREQARQNAPKPIITQAQQRSTQISNQVKSSSQSARICNDQALASPAGQVVTKSILVSTDNQSNKFDLLSSKAKLTDSQKISLKKYLTAITACRKIQIDGNAGLPFQSVLMKNYVARDAIYTKLLTGQMTIGEANLAIQQQNVSYGDERKAEANKLDQSLKNQNTAEVQSIQRQRQLQIENQQRQQLIDQAQPKQAAPFSTPNVTLTPGITQGTPIPVKKPSFNTRTCTSMVNGNMITTNCN